MAKDYARIEKILHYIEDNIEAQPELEELSRVVNLSPFHLQRRFKSWAGVSPKQYLKLATLKKAKQYLNKDSTILEASLSSGLSSSSRLHDHFITLEGITPGEYKSGGKGITFFYGSVDARYGNMFICWTPRGIHSLLFANDVKEELLKFKNNWPLASFENKQEKAEALVRSIFNSRKQKLVLRPHGSPFQIQVWKALLNIPTGYCTSYGELAKQLGKPSAARAVGSAVGANSLAILIPCHRVIQASGTIGEYRWGEQRKRVLLAQEHCLKRQNVEKEIV